ncbi:MAG: class I SAM-dependent methyltransferase [Gammaproteobacteria bacterium]
MKFIKHMSLTYGMKVLLKSLFKKLTIGHLEVILPNHQTLTFSGRHANDIRADWHFNNWKPIWASLRRGSVGLGESYIKGDWSTSDLKALLTLIAANEKSLLKALEGIDLLRFKDRKYHKENSNTEKQASKNIISHYDLGNTFYSAWLDPSMTYSSAIFDNANVSLELAQQEKYKRLSDMLNIQKGEKVLEIGSGWGGFATYTAKNLQADITGISLSKAQTEYARNQFKNEGIAETARVNIQDYRNTTGEYKHIVSIEMFEAVGEEYWDEYAGKIKDLLASDGAAALQIITIEDARFERYRRTPDFIQRYVFPGGMLPTYKILRSTFERAGLRITDDQSYGNDYAKTLSIWRRNFNEAWADIHKLGFDEEFKRLWEFYLVYCEVGFLQKSIDVVQIKVEHK